MTFVVTDEGGRVRGHRRSAAAALERHEQAPLERIAVHTGEVGTSRWDTSCRCQPRPAARVVARRDTSWCLNRPSGASSCVTWASTGSVTFAARPGLRASGRRRRSSPPLRSLDRIPNNLPIELTSFVGRDAELAAVDELLGRERLVTITGSGGSARPASPPTPRRRAIAGRRRVVDRAPGGQRPADRGRTSSRPASACSSIRSAGRCDRLPSTCATAGSSCVSTTASTSSTLPPRRSRR